MSAVRTACVALLPLLAVSAFAQTPAAKAPSAPSVSVPGVSPAGNAIITKSRNMPDQQLRVILGQLKDVSSQLQLETQRPQIDLDKLATLLKRREGLVAQSQTRQDDRLLALLKALAPEDRAAFLRALSAPRAAPTN